MRRRNFILTENNPTKEIFELWGTVDLEGLGIKYFVWQGEMGKEGTPHLQGYIEFNRKMRITTMKKMEMFKKTHIEPRYGTRSQARKYCMKEDTRKCGPYEFGIFARQGYRSDLSDCRNDILNGLTLDEAIIEHSSVSAKYPRFIRDCRRIHTKFKAQELYMKWDQRKVTVIYGPSGIGKTKSIYDKHEIDDIYHYRKTGKSGTPWFNGYDGQKVILIDDFYGEWNWSFLLNFLDKYPMQVEIKGDYVWLNWEKIYITSNDHPMDWYDFPINWSPLERRIDKIIELNEKD